MGKWRKKPVVVDAFQFTGVHRDDYPEWFINEIVRGRAWYVGEMASIGTLEGEMRASPGDYIICGVKGELYPCRPDIFAATYEPVEV